MASPAWLLRDLEPKRRLLKPKAQVFRAGQAAGSVFLVNSGVFKTSFCSDDGREKIIGFRMRGELLGIESLGLPGFACDAVSLGIGEVWEFSRQQLAGAGSNWQQSLTSLLAAEIRRDWEWMLATSTLSAEQRVVCFLLDLAVRMEAMGFSGSAMTLHMTRSEVGNFLALQLETVVRAMSKLQALGLIGIDGRHVTLRDLPALRAIVARPHLASLRAA
ncbi:MAG: helix-turn-helix domain-containing protein [Arenimonas sp.]